MLNLNTSSLSLMKSTGTDLAWKVLIYDELGQDIISPLLTVKELRDLGVTLHVSLKSDRDPVDEIAAVYFIMPTKDNIARIGKDLAEGLYESYYLNFIAPIPRDLLEDLATAALESNVQQNIAKIYDQYLDFITLEDDLLCLRQAGRDSISYFALNRPQMLDVQMDQIIGTIVDSLFSVCVTLGSVPIIRCPKGEAAEIVGEKLDKKLRENLRDPRNSLFSSDSMATGALSFQRPLLVILDRSIDLASLLHHTWTYQALAHDILDFKLNRVEIEEFDETITTGDGRHPSKRRTYDLIPTDKFWKQQKGNPFPIVAESIQEELERYRQLEGEVTRLKTAMGIKGDAEDLAISLLNDTTSKLTSAVSSLPELLEKKRLLDLHTNIATALLDQIKKRKLDVFFETEEKLITKQVQEKSLMEVLSDPAAGTPEDKLRLFLIHYICTPTMTQSELDQYMTILRGSNCTHLEAIAYIKRWKSISKMSVVSQAREGGTTTMGMFSNLVNKASKFAMEGVKNLVVKQYKLPVTKILDNLMESRSSPETDDYRYFDPKLLRPADSANVARNRQSFSDAIVFMIGGGNYIEYQNLQDYAKTRSTMATKRVVYGCTELVNASQFLEHSKNFSEEEIDNFRQCFQLFAPQGYVDTPDKLCFIMRSLSMAPTLVELKRYFTKYKKDAGVVEFDDFLKIILEHRSVENTSNEIMAAFQLYDTKKHGYIDAKQLRYILTHTGEKMTDRDVDLILRELNVTSDGRVVYKNLVQMLAQPLAGHR
ncbi:unnamed protein product [Rotaria socialis]|uniref:EF-hand domain-containing protein n=4 Tax=Rotaria socialis TaxID=392032 RepID=A0A821H7N3_9BILA|nr:unnamed protein product [Rotaria socialis]CAF4544977.1 unnamed protein product [Rotaria socialis]CAF4676320.1 unnamed protein product [Rotaria socialis]